MNVTRTMEPEGVEPAGGWKATGSGYLLAVLSVVLAHGLMILLGGLMKQELSLLFFLAVVISSRYGGLYPGLLATCLAVLDEIYFFVPPPYTFVVHTSDLLRLGIFVTVAMLISSLNAARKRAEEAVKHERDRVGDLNRRLNRAMTEMNHRIKNNLQLISAMTEMRIPEGQDIVPVQELRELNLHIRTLAKLHDMLTRKTKRGEEAETISAKALLEELLPLLQQTTGNYDCQARLEEISLTTKQGSSLTLLVNELVTNAVKHGRSEIGVSLRRQGDKAILEVVDDGMGFPQEFDPAQAANTGLELIESLTRLDMRGHTNYQNRAEGGACVTVTFPLSSQH